MRVRPRHARRSRGGFTLLEVLITTILLATLLTGIWGLYRMFGSLYETGYVQTEQAQLLRTLIQQLSEDLAGTITPPAQQARPASSAPAAVRVSGSGGAQGLATCAARVGLLGTYNSLRLDIVRTDPPASRPRDLERFALKDDSQWETSGEIVTVVYAFQAPADAEEEAPLSRPGLKRQEIRVNQSTRDDWEAAESLMEPAARWRRTAGTRQEADFEQNEKETFEASFERAGLSREPAVNLPEVVALEFRYFDGHEWQDAWDSRSRGSLPLAVEVTVQIDFSSELERRPKPARDSVAAAPSSPSGRTPEQTQRDLLPANTTSVTTRTPSHRFVIYLSQAVKGQGGDSQGDAAVAQDAGAATAGVGSPGRAPLAPPVTARARVPDVKPP